MLGKLALPVLCYKHIPSSASSSVVQGTATMLYNRDQFCTSLALYSASSFYSLLKNIVQQNSFDLIMGSLKLDHSENFSGLVSG